jgi:hypothetical protein
VLGQHPASPYCRGGSNGDTGDRMTAAGRMSSAIPHNIHGGPGPIGLANTPACTSLG